MKNPELPYVYEIKELVHSPRVREWCRLSYHNHPKGCPKWNDPKSSHQCPPGAPYITDILDTVFINSMSDPWDIETAEDAENVKKTLGAIRERPDVRFLTLTKVPKGYLEFADRLPSNLWCGVTITGDDFRNDANRWHWLLKTPSKRFISFEPMLGDGTSATILISELKHLDWLIIGPLNKKGHDPVTKREWVERIIDVAQAANVPVFLKDALYKKGIMTEAEVKERQEIPWRHIDNMQCIKRLGESDYE